MAKLRCPAKSGGSSTVSVTVYSAVADTVSIQYGGTTSSITTDSSGKAESVTLPIGAVTLTSSIAKDPSSNNLSDAYSKTINVTSATTDVYVMPDGALYWYGFNNGVQTLSTANGWSSSGTLKTFRDPTYGTNSVTANTNYTACYCGIGSTQKVSASKICAITKGITGPTNYGQLAALNSKDVVDTATTATSITSGSVTKYEVSLTQGNYNAVIYSSVGGTASTRSQEISALWYE